MRKFNYPIMPEIMRRWSPRAFSPAPLQDDDVPALLEAARYAPSCFNGQPWRFVIAQTEQERALMISVLNDTNRVWAQAAPVLVLVCAKRHFEHNGKDNFWHMFDTGTAWGFLALEAERRGLITHAMGGFSRERAIETFSLGTDIQPIAVVAIGKPGDPATLTPELAAREKPGVRRAVSELVIKINT